MRQAAIVALLVPAFLLGGALISQYGFGLAPCEMCIWQRWPHGFAILLALLSFFITGDRVKKLFILDAALMIMVSGLIGGYHAGVEYGWWEGLTACASGVPQGADILEAIMEAPITRCDVAPWSLFGISLAGYNFLLSCAGAISILALLYRPQEG